MTALSTIIIAPRAEHRYSVIWLHGLGADGHDFEGIVPQLEVVEKTSIRFVFPNAPVQPVTINGGMAMRAWYDITETALQRQVDIEGIYRSAAEIVTLIEQEIARGIAPENILLAGFSQGSVIALHTGLRYPKRLAGIIALSGYLPTVAGLATEASEANKPTPIFMAHGVADSVVPIKIARQAHDDLTARHYPVQWREYAMQHSVCQQEVAHISHFMNSVLSHHPESRQ